MDTLRAAASLSFNFCLSCSYCVSIKLLTLVFFGTVSLLSSTFIISTKSSSSVVVSGKPVHPTHLAMACSLVSCSFESVLYFEELRNAAEMACCWVAVALFPLGPWSTMSSVLFWICEDKYRGNQVMICFFLTQTPQICLLLTHTL